MSSHYCTQRRGFTLIELVIGLALLALLTTQAASVLSNLKRNWERWARSAAAQQLNGIIATLVSKDLRANAPVQYRFSEGKIGRQSGKSWQYLTTEGEIQVFSLEAQGEKLWVVTLGSEKFYVARRN
jgi:prepilin-type N-terminal cleavage/methylation domain-containing protein